jgi:transcriptional regulator
MKKGRFGSHGHDGVVRLVTENPLAWIFVQDGDGPFATAAPIRPVAADGLLNSLIGHVPRGRRIAKCLEQKTRGLILVLGPHGYISPSWMSDRTQAPTWNFTSVQFVAELRLVDDSLFLESHLRDLTGALERGRTRAWNVDEMGARLEKLAARIVAFEATIIGRDDRFKLGQNEDDRTYAEIIRALEDEGKRDLLAWMRAFNSRRN